MDFYKITIFNWRYKFTFNSRNFCWENGEGYRSPLIRLVSREWLTARGLANQKPWFLLRFRPIRALGFISNKKKRLIKRNRREPSEESAISGEEVRKKRLNKFCKRESWVDPIPQKFKNMQNVLKRSRKIRIFSFYFASMNREV